jgi:hypothetical protein
MKEVPLALVVVCAWSEALAWGVVTSMATEPALVAITSTVTSVSIAVGLLTGTWLLAELSMRVDSA